MQTIFDVLSKTKKGDKLTDGKRFWKVVETETSSDCVIAMPLKSKWPKKESLFELWGDSQSKVSCMPQLKITKNLSKRSGK